MFLTIMPMNHRGATAEASTGHGHGHGHGGGQGPVGVASELWSYEVADLSQG